MTERRSIEPGTGDGWRVVDAAVRSARDRLGDGLLSAYAIGSLAHGGFRPAVSDVDLALLTDERPGRDARAIAAAVAADVTATGHGLADRLSIFHAPWAAFCEPPRDARFPAIDRYDLVHHGILVDGVDLRDAHARAPTAAQIRAQAVDSALCRVALDKLRGELCQLRDRGVTVHDASKTVLWPVRLQHVCETGAATGNGAAVGHYLESDDARHRWLVRDALAWRDLPMIPDPGTTLRRIGDEIHDLYAEVLARVVRHPDVPRRDELAALHRQLTAET